MTKVGDLLERLNRLLNESGKGEDMDINQYADYIVEQLKAAKSEDDAKKIIEKAITQLRSKNYSEDKIKSFLQNLNRQWGWLVEGQVHDQSNILMQKVFQILNKGKDK